MCLPIPSLPYNLTTFILHTAKIIELGITGIGCLHKIVISCKTIIPNFIKISSPELILNQRTNGHIFNL